MVQFSSCIRVYAFCLALLMGYAGAASAETRRVGFLFANHNGGQDLPMLRYAERDSSRMHDVLVQSGGFEDEDVISLLDANADDIRYALDELQRTIAQYVAQGDRVMLVLYYSGHAANGILRLNDSMLPMQEIKDRLDENPAQIKLVFLDSCGAGAMTREKGGTLAPPFLIAVDDHLEATGQVIITSSSADEASQESDEIQGSFFTHYLTSGLRGAADENKDERVTLDELYAYAYAKTVASTANTRSGTQHPTYAYDITGAGEIVMSRFGENDVIMTFPPSAAGRYLIVDDDRQLFVAEIEKEKGGESKLALPPGRYVIKKRLASHLLMKRFAHQEKGQITIDDSTMEVVAFEDDYAKGMPLLIEEIDDGFGFSLSLGMGGQFVFDDPSAGELFPPIAFVSMEARLTNVFSEYLVLSADLGFGTRQHTMNLEQELGTSYDILYSQFQVGASSMLQMNWGPFLAAVGPRMAILYVRADYFDPNAPVTSQYFLTGTPGVVGLVGFSLWDVIHFEAQARTHYLLYNLEDRNLGYVEGLLSVWVDF